MAKRLLINPNLVAFFRKGNLIRNAMERGRALGSNPQPSVQKAGSLTAAPQLHKRDMATWPRI